MVHYTRKREEAVLSLRTAKVFGAVFGGEIVVGSVDGRFVQWNRIRVGSYAGCAGTEYPERIDLRSVAVLFLRWPIRSFLKKTFSGPQRIGRATQFTGGIRRRIYIGD